MNKGKIIVARSKNFVIGFQGKMPWNYPEDLAYFKSVTMGKIVVMGRKTFESIGKPLSGRTNIILSKTLKESKGVLVFRNIENLKSYLIDKNYFVIGGEQIYRQFLSIVDEIYLTQINRYFKGNSFFPKIGKNWKIISQKKGENSDLVFKILRKRGKNEI